MFASRFFEDENFLIGINAETFIYFNSSSSMIILASAFFLSRVFIIKSATCTSYPSSFNSSRLLISDESIKITIRFLTNEIRSDGIRTVSYTHLTLPTNREV